MHMVGVRVRDGRADESLAVSRVEDTGEELEWVRIDLDPKRFTTTRSGGPDWRDVVWRRVEADGEILEDESAEGK